MFHAKGHFIPAGTLLHLSGSMGCGSLVCAESFCAVQKSQNGPKLNTHSKSKIRNVQGCHVRCRVRAIRVAGMGAQN